MPGTGQFIKAELPPLINPMKRSSRPRPFNHLQDALGCPVSFLVRNGMSPFCQLDAMQAVWFFKAFYNHESAGNPVPQGFLHSPGHGITCLPCSYYKDPAFLFKVPSRIPYPQDRTFQL